MNTDSPAGLQSRRVEGESTQDEPHRVVKAGNNVDSWGPFRLWSDGDDEDDFKDNQNHSLDRKPSDPTAFKDTSIRVSSSMRKTMIPFSGNQTETSLQLPRHDLALQLLPKPPARLPSLPRSTFKFETTQTGEQKTSTIPMTKSWNHRTRAPFFPQAGNTTTQGIQSPEDKPPNVDYLFNMISNHVKPDPAHNGPDFPTHTRNLENAITRLRMKKQTLNGVYLRTYNIDERASIKPRLDNAAKKLERKEAELASVRKAYQAAEEIASSFRRGVDKAVDIALADASPGKKQPEGPSEQRRPGAYNRADGRVASAGDVGPKTPQPFRAPRPKAAVLAVILEEEESGRGREQETLGEHEPNQEPAQASEPVVLEKPGRRPWLDRARTQVTHIFHRYFGGRHGSDDAQLSSQYDP
ncbi:hypothetical protein PspLS_01727 [Pyricularia sp. CBS 133598]|nr:hypothetical protein PspLS_01727 [Pyricularia sp. CBS 133598]